MSAFLLGIWMGCSVFMAIVVLDNSRAPGAELSSPSGQAAAFLKKLTPDDVRLLLHYQAEEQSRRYLSIWEETEFGLALALGACLFLGTQRQPFPLVFCALMLMMVAFQHFAISPELTYRGRQADFPPGNTAFGTQTRLWALEQVYAGTEGAKLLLGGILASYLFVFRTRQARKPSGLPDRAATPKSGAIAGGGYNGE